MDKTPPSERRGPRLDIERPPSTVTPVVGVGASAGGLDAFVRLLRRVPTDTGYAFVLVQHLDANHPSSLSEILARATAMPVGEVRDAVPVSPNRVFVIPPNTELTIADGVLKLSPRRPGRAGHMPVDHFLRSLARERGGGAIGVILSGAGSDGAAGVAAIQEAGGVTFAQDPATAEFTSMPTMAAAGGVDFVLAPEEIATELARIARHPHFAESTQSEEQAPEADDGEAGQFQAICDVLRAATGVDFALYRKQTIFRRVRRRLALRNIASLGEYARLLAGDAAEQSALQRELLISVTSFFREPDSFDGLKRLVFPIIVRDRPANHTIRIWVPGCASGEEAYSILIALEEFQGEHGTAFPVQLFASDLSEAAIEKARAGRYSANIAEVVSRERLLRHFTKIDGGYQIAKSLRERCVFSRHNLLQDPPFSKLDLISCRNVLIYLDGVQKTIIPVFHYALAERGFLMLGRSETVHFAELFTTVEPRLRIYAKLPATRVRSPLLAPPGRRPRGIAGVALAQPPRAPVAGGDLSREVDRILLSKYSPVGVLVTEDLAVVEIRGRTAPFLRLPTGKLSFHLVKLLPDTGLYLEVEAAVQESATTGKPARREHVAYESEGRIGSVNVEATPIGGTGSRVYLILFEAVAETGIASTGADGHSSLQDADAAESEVIDKLKRELQNARRRLDSLVEEHETIDQEQQQATEDALSSNEELQSLTEELETAKEELQSTNEELITVNRDLEARNSALTTAREFARSIVETVRVPLIVVDARLNIVHVNAMFDRAFGTPPRDIEGRPLYSVCGGAWDVPAFRQLVEAVLPADASFDAFEMEREFPSIGTRNLVISGRRLDDLDMVLLTVEDVTAKNDAERALHKSEERRRQAEKMEAIGQLAGGIAHDFNNLLTVIVGHCELLGEKIDAVHDGSEDVIAIRQAAQRAAALTDQLLAFSRRKVLQPKVISLNPIVLDFEKMLRRLLGETIDIVLGCATDLWQVRTDPGEFGRLLMNLCLNARDAMPAGGRLTIETVNVELDEDEAGQHDLSAGRHVLLVVGDTGLGIAPEIQARVFEPFFTTKERGAGTGLGLATVLGIAQQGGGAVACESEIGNGTQFKVWLPALAATAEVVPPAERGHFLTPSTASEVILLVEDDVSVRRLGRRILEKAGYVVLEAGDGREGLSLLQKHQGTIHLLLSDVVLPGLAGRELAKHALALRPGLKVLFVSGHTEDQVLKEGVRRGQAFLAKPFTPAALSRKVREALDSSAGEPGGDVLG